ncbi:hypothetical protein [Pseudomonas phage vB_PaeM_PS119XW]|uniref:Uncharacterized protein n=1 Tax=Pseudomonas phage vB_PaeM_PS119XW TaxID=2601632 RepID=A0A5C1K840_9CAUD|nr:hypothetical protein PP933_gp343 [Pseudomonas phage vB_PaeM_PS119XW]QEM42072.1 hypothetical protein [Pseudomonas phage vB_PaeM_PS119XW]
MKHIVVYGKQGVIIARDKANEDTDIRFDWGMRREGEEDLVTYRGETAKLLVIQSGDWAANELVRNRLKILDFGGNIIDVDIIDALTDELGNHKGDICVALFTDHSVTTFTRDYSDNSTRVITDIYPETGMSFVKSPDVDLDGLENADTFDEFSQLFWKDLDLIINGWYEFK